MKQSSPNIHSSDTRPGAALRGNFKQNLIWGLTTSTQPTLSLTLKSSHTGAYFIMEICIEQQAIFNQLAKHFDFNGGI